MPIIYKMCNRHIYLKVGHKYQLFQIQTEVHRKHNVNYESEITNALVLCKTESTIKCNDS